MRPKEEIIFKWSKWLCAPCWLPLLFDLGLERRSARSASLALPRFSEFAAMVPRLSRFSQPRQWDEEVFLMLVTGGPGVRSGGGMP